MREEVLGEVFRLGVIGGNVGVVDDVTVRLGGRLLAVSRFREVKKLAETALELGSGDAAVFNAAGQAEIRLGNPAAALDYYNQALPIRRAVGDRQGEAGTLNDIGMVYDALGDRQQALDHYNQALPIQRAVGDRHGEAITRYNMAMIHRANGDPDDAIAELEIVVHLDKAVGHPDLEADTAVLNQLKEQREGDQ